MLFGPAAKRTERLDQSPAKAGKRIFNPRRDHRKNFASDETVALEAAQSLRQHFLGDAADLAVEFGVAHCLFREQLNRNRRPFVGDAIENEPGGTLRIHD